MGLSEVLFIFAAAYVAIVVSVFAVSAGLVGVAVSDITRRQRQGERRQSGRKEQRGHGRNASVKNFTFDK